MKRFYILFALLVIAVAGLSVAAQTQQQSFTPVTDEMLWKPSPNDWLTWRRTLDSQGFSPLNEINRNNVSQLKMMWSRGIVSGRTQEATPLVYNGTMYMPNPGDIIMAMDAKTGDLKWEYGSARGRQRRHQPEHGDLGERRSSTPAPTTALRDRRADRQAGVGNRRCSRRGARANASSGPIIANGKVITGRQCQPDADQRRLHRHRARREDRQGGLADAHDSASR